MYMISFSPPIPTPSVRHPLPVGKKCIFGQLSQLTEGVYSLEDPHAHIPLNLTSPELMLSSGLFTEGCMVLVEGETRDDGVFHASTLISPPAEPRMKTLTACPPLDWLGSNLAAHANTPEKQLKIDLLKSSSHADDMIVILSDVHLDKPKVLQKIATMLEGLKEHVPPAFVFMGNFTSAPFANQPGEMQKLKGKTHFWFDTWKDEESCIQIRSRTVLSCWMA